MNLYQLLLMILLICMMIVPSASNHPLKFKPNLRDHFDRQT